MSSKFNDYYYYKYSITPFFSYDYDYDYDFIEDKILSHTSFGMIQLSLSLLFIVLQSFILFVSFVCGHLEIVLGYL